jgi:hypothetical protein
MKIIIILAYIWIMVYTVSYMMYEFKRKNRPASFSVAFIAIAATLLTAVAFL